ncbi:replication protein [Cytobacillus firmus]|uniref:replication protein n=1 Tax=Cytobacillus firmus TaxID=1399 RepID=UPI00222824CF|nr:replication protein [Cytobacillus firmus]
MASSRIKGITVEIGGDTIGLQNALRDVNNRTKEVQQELKDVERLLKFDPNNVELLAQRQQLLTEAIQSTTDKLNQLKSAEAQVQAQFERGEISQEQYRGFRRELQQTEQQLNGYQQALADMDVEQQRVEQGTRTLQTLFDATGTSVENYANVIGQRLVRAIQDGTATSRDLEYAFQRIGRDAIGANGDIERLRTSLQSVDNGNSIQNVRNDLQQLQTEAQETAESVEGIGVELENVAGALVAGGGIAGAVSQALDMSSLDTKIDITFEVPEESKQSVKEAVLGIEAYGLDAEEALEGVRRQWALNKDASDEVNASISKGAAAIAKNFAGVDFVELIQETNEVAAALKISNEEALALTNALLKAGFPPEQLDTLSEYGQQMKDIGFTTAEIQAIFEAGVNTKTWNIDNLNDGVKEARLQMATFGLEVDENLGKLVEKSGISSKQFQDWGKSVAEGGEKGSKAMSEVATWLDGIEDKTLKNELATKVFGTKWEDQGQNMIAVFQGVATASDQTNDNINGLYETMGKTNADPMVELQHAINNVKIAAEPTLQVIADIISKIANWIAENPKLAATIATIVSAIGILMGIFMALAPIITSVATMATALGVSIGAVSIPILAVIAGIAALIAIGVLLYKNWDEIVAKAKELWSKVHETWEQFKLGTQLAFEAIKQLASSKIEEMKTAVSEKVTALRDKVSEMWTSAKTKTAEIVESLRTIAGGKFEALRTLVGEKMRLARDKISELWSSAKTKTGELVEGLKNIARSKFENLRTAVQEKMSAVKTKVEEIWKKAQGFLENINLLSIGKDIIQGLISGLAGKAGDIYAKVGEIAGKIKSKFTGLFDIHSPSRVFKEYGFNMNEGLIQGLQSSATQLYNAVDGVYGHLSNSAQSMMQLDQAKVNPVISQSGSGPVTFNFERMLEGAIFNVREDADIDRIAEKLYQKQRRAARSMGVVRK